MKSMAERIKYLREKNNMTQDDLAAALKMNRANISNYERGVITKIPSNVLNTLADVLKTNADYLLGRTDDPSPHRHTIPEWASSKDKRDFKKMLEEEGELMFDGVPMSDEDKQRIMDVLTGFFWEAKQMNKKTYGRKKGGKNDPGQDGNGKAE